MKQFTPPKLVPLTNKTIALLEIDELRNHTSYLRDNLNQILRHYELEIARCKDEVSARIKDSVVNDQRHKGELPKFESLRFNHFKRQCKTNDDFLLLFTRIEDETP
tara:strand:- start:803 stop:1120 length:318 start_codon:yes stop_codon:yes gene_type:complete